MSILVTGAAGFIGAHVLQRLRAQGRDAVGLDNFNDYYDVRLKRDRLAALAPGAVVEEIDCADEEALRSLFARHGIRKVIHLAAQAGVRYSLINPQAYIRSNLVGFANILECCRHASVEHLVYASSSSVYGNHENLPWDENDAVAHPVSLYAATKASNELLAHSYSHLYRLPATGLRFFTVYGPWGRPDMAPMLFSKAILAGEPIRVFNHGRMQRDFTYIDDIVEAVCRLVDKPAQPDPAFNRQAPRPATSDAPHRLFNIGNHEPVELLAFIDVLEQALGRPAIRQLEPMQPGDVLATYAATERLDDWVGFKPSTPLQRGIERFAAWYRSYYPVH
jgi:UDP-glucuronate 4-epimerase